MFVRSILPIGLLFSASLILSNTAYLYLSVAYIQMLKVCLSPSLLFSLFLKKKTDVSFVPIGFYSCCYPPYLLDIPHSGTQPKTSYYCVHDLVWRRTSVSWRVAFQPHWFPHSGRGRWRTLSHSVALERAAL